MPYFLWKVKNYGFQKKGRDPEILLESILPELFSGASHRQGYKGITLESFFGRSWALDQAGKQKKDVEQQKGPGPKANEKRTSFFAPPPPPEKIVSVCPQNLSPNDSIMIQK